MPEPLTDAEIETQRLETAHDELKNFEEDRCAEAAPGTFYAHEALHMCSYLLQSFEAEVMHHPHVLREPEYYRLAHKAHDLMYRLYQAIGDKHLSHTDGEGK